MTRVATKTVLWTRMTISKRRRPPIIEGSAKTTFFVHHHPPPGPIRGVGVSAADCGHRDGESNERERWSQPHRVSAVHPRLHTPW